MLNSKINPQNISHNINSKTMLKLKIIPNTLKIFGNVHNNVFSEHI